MPDGLVEERLHKVEVEIIGLNSQMSELRTRLAVKDERERHVDEKLRAIKEDVDGLKSAVNKVLWLVVAAIIGGLMQFILRGGLNLVSGQ